MCVDLKYHKVSDLKMHPPSYYSIFIVIIFSFQEPNNPQFQCTTNALFIFYSWCCLIRISKGILFPLLKRIINKGTIKWADWFLSRLPFFTFSRFTTEVWWFVFLDNISSSRLSYFYQSGISPLQTIYEVNKCKLWHTFGVQWEVLGKIRADLRRIWLFYLQNER